MKNRYGFEKAVADIDEMLADPSIGVVSVALPNNLHAQVLPKVIASGKHLFAEKPIGRTPAEAAELARLAAGSDAVTGVGFSFRRLPGLAAIAQAVAEGQIGEVYSVRAWYYADYAADPQGALSWRYDQELSGGGAVLDIGAHAIDAAQFVAGPIETVLDAQLRTVIAQRPAGRRRHRAPRRRHRRDRPGDQRRRRGDHRPVRERRRRHGDAQPDRLRHAELAGR